MDQIALFISEQNFRSDILPYKTIKNIIQIYFIIR